MIYPASVRAIDLLNLSGLYYFMFLEYSWSIDTPL